jgi:RNA polymerase sigma-70 factor (ECF subfamily)
MASTPEPSTRSSLLDRLRRDPADQEAWGAFAECYGRLIYGWCRHWRLQEADAQDVTQDVLLILSQRLKTFTYDPSLGFRNWLHTVTRHAWLAFAEGRRRAPAAGGGGPVELLLEEVAAREDLVQRLQEQFDHELLEMAMDRVRRRVEPHTWEAFRLLALEQRPAAEAARRLGMKVATAYVARGKVRKMVRAELRRLEQGPPPGPPEGGS